MAKGVNTAHHPDRQVGRHRFVSTAGRPAGFYQREAIGPLGGAEAFERDIANEGYERDQRRNSAGLYPDER
jgi:hypothetical protein